MIIWDDQAVYEFLDEWSNHSRTHEILCAAAVDRIEFKTVDVNDIIRRSYKLYPKRVLMWNLRYKKGEKIGTLFCRSRIVKGKQKWFLKDGNHRFIAMVANGEEKMRIGYDSENRI